MSPMGAAQANAQANGRDDCLWFRVRAQTPQTSLPLLLVHHCRYSTPGYHYHPNNENLNMAEFNDIGISMYRLVYSLVYSL